MIISSTFPIVHKIFLHFQMKLVISNFSAFRFLLDSSMKAFPINVSSSHQKSIPWPPWFYFLSNSLQKMAITIWMTNWSLLWLGVFGNFLDKANFFQQLFWDFDEFFLPNKIDWKRILFQLLYSRALQAFLSQFYMITIFK